MIMRQSRTTLSASNRQAALLILRLRRMEVLLQMSNHLITRITVDPQKRVIISNGI